MKQKKIKQLLFIEGIPYVVAVQSNLKIEEEMAQEFSTNFYTSIFSGQEVQKAFELAKNMSKNIRGDNCYTCCCAHEHAKNCKWKLKCNGDCSKHTPSSDCDCPKKNELIHKFSFDEQCRWAKSFIEELDLYTSEELDEIMLEDEEINVCCCKDATKEIKHDEIFYIN
ncbi:hypothetical protein PPERSA_04441 [Pseudocohnilembus persalinus]|uniref:Uncharacterized protein n=1 Tax=Pseudocohnilembus persalinus TaxID=266149 RepID=A0A0V0QQQ0_PSEPJ|nr:hypothetical protein PPERSA_04441 [Pseudocohnilembus persalinus]|eukprot:KRX04626.1 hypothetical protein PPERSA_04441 [Pseudocohnilembus persalinus]